MDNRRKSKSAKINTVSPEVDSGHGIQRTQKPQRRGQTYIYNPDNMPPDFHQALIHKKATMVGMERNLDQSDGGETAIDIDEQYCKCCTRKTDKEKFKIMCKLDELAYLGPGYPLYFDFVKFCGVLLISIFISSGAFNLFTNFYYGDDCKTTSEIVDKNNECYKDWVTEYSLGNKKSQIQLMDYQNYVNIGSIIILIIMFQFFRNHVKKIDIKYDILDINPKDYSIWVSNIPINFKALNDDYDDDLQNFLEEEIFGGDPKFKIDQINLCYNMTNVQNLTKDKFKRIKEKAEIIWFQHKEGYFKPGRTIAMINSEINEFQVKIDDYLNQYYEGQGQEFMAKYFAGQAFVSFSDPSVREELVEKYGYTGICSGKQPLIFHGNKLEIRDAPDPLNINWDNLNVNSQSLREIISYVFTLVFVGGAFFSVFYYTDFKTSFTEDISNQILLFAVTFVVSFIINGFNFGILILCKKLTTGFERQQSKTLYNISAIKKIALGQFLVTAWVIYVIDIVLDQEGQSDQTNYGKAFKEGGLAYNSNVVIIGNTIIPFMVELTDIKQIFKKIKQCTVRRYNKNNIPLLKTQQELNKIFENPDFNIIMRYSLVLKTMYLISFYAPIIPSALLWGLLSLFLTYWIDKYNILRRRSVLDSLSTELAIEMIEMLEFCIILYTLGNLAAMVYLIETIEYTLMSVIRSWPAYGVYLGILHAALPMQWVNERVFNLPDNPPNIQTYEEAQSQFITDYQRTNPATAEIAKQQHFRKINLQMKQQKEKRRKSQFLQIQTKNKERFRRASVRTPAMTNNLGTKKFDFGQDTQNQDEEQLLKRNQEKFKKKQNGKQRNQ